MRNTDCQHQRRVVWDEYTGCLDCGKVFYPVVPDVVIPPIEPVRRTRTPKLSKTGQIVMEMLAQGYSYQDIAGHIGKSVGVVKMFETISKKAMKGKK